MSDSLTHYRHSHRSAEARLIWKTDVSAVEGKLSELQDRKYAEKGAEFSEWMKKAEAQDLFAYFVTEGSKRISRDDLLQYYDAHADTLDALPPNHILRQLHQDLITEADPAQVAGLREAAFSRINTLVEYLQMRADVVRQSKDELKKVVPEEGGAKLPPVTEWTSKNITGTLGALTKGFMDASFQEKGLMVAGIAATVLVFRWMLQQMDRTEATKLLKNTVGVTLGLGTAGLVAALGAEAANKALGKTTGKNALFWVDGGHAIVPQGEWTVETKKSELEKAYASLKDENIPMDMLKDLTADPEGQEQYAFGIANLVTLTTADFVALYEEYRADKTIPDDAGNYPLSPFRKDYLNPIRRFQLVEQMGKGLGLLDAAMDVVPLTEEQEKETMLHVAIKQWEEMEKA